MRLTIAAILLAASLFAAMPAQARQGGTFMWCTAWTEVETGKTFFYSAFFPAGAWEADRKALAFKNHVEKANAIKVKATCMAPAAYEAAVATRNAAMKGAPGKILAWEG